MYGYQQPMMQPMMQPVMQPVQPMYMAPPPPVQQGPTIITIGGNNNNNDGTYCPVCNKNTNQIVRKNLGCVNVLWCFCLCSIIGPLGLIALCNDSYKDSEIVCTNCQTVKSTVPANCCWMILSFISVTLEYFSLFFLISKKSLNLKEK